MSSSIMFFFFFQAEDGIRDSSVTGVQTCALPISGRSPYRLAVLIGIVVGVIGLIVLGNCPVLAQGFAAAITGTVQDSSGAAVPGATLTARHVETGLTRAVEADASGNYTIPSVPVGAYEVTAEKTGFRQEVRRGITLVVAQEAVVNFTF